MNTLAPKPVRIDPDPVAVEVSDTALRITLVDEDISVRALMGLPT